MQSQNISKHNAFIYIIFSVIDFIHKYPQSYYPCTRIFYHKVMIDEMVLLQEK